MLGWVAVMNIDQELKAFPGVCRLFPLPGIVLFPHTILPLHIFEPRYRQLTADALASDHLVTLAQPRSPERLAATIGEPELERIGCVGKIINAERFADGRYNFLLVGLGRVVLHAERRCPTLYRQYDGEILEDIEPTPSIEALRPELLDEFEYAIRGAKAEDADLMKLLRSPLPMGMLTDVMAQALPLPESLKQSLLFDPLVANRVELLLEALRGRNGRGGPAAMDRWSRPSPFSNN